MRNRQQYVEYEGHRSEPYFTWSGVSQGSNLGPLQFIIMINDLPKVVKEANCLLLADDLKLSLAVRGDDDCQRLQKADSEADSVVTWSKENLLQFGQEYAQVTKMLGNGRLEAMCFDGIKRLCHIRGKLRKKVWINQGDIILIGLRDYQDAKADVILKYTPDEARNLKTYGEFPETVRINETVVYSVDGLDEDIEFGDEVSSEDEADAVDAI